MIRKKKKSSSFVLLSLLMAVMVVFAGIGITYAYFQSEKNINDDIGVGGDGIAWYNYTTQLTNSNVYQLAGAEELARGNADGTSILQPDGSSGGDLRLVSSVTTGQYVRIKYTAMLGKNLINVADFSDSVSNAQANVCATDYQLVAGRTYTLSFGYNISSSTLSSVVCKVGCGSTSYLTDIASKSYSGSGNLSLTFSPTASQISSGNKLFIKFSSGASNHTTTNVLSNIQLEEGGVATDYEAYIEQVDVSSYLTFRYVTTETTAVMGTNDFWKLGDDGWYYYMNSQTSNVLTSTAFAPVCNNIVLANNYSTRYLGHTITIRFSYDVLQSQNAPVEGAWGTSAKTILGL